MTTLNASAPSAHAHPTSADPDLVDPAAFSLTALADHIEATHHVYVRATLPRLEGMIQKVVRVHGTHDARLTQVEVTFRQLVWEMTAHMQKEEQILFPMIRQLEAGDTAPAFHCGSLANPIRVMEAEHDAVGAALTTLRELTDGFTPPDWACPTLRATLEGLAALELDTHRHVHKENNILFPRAIEREAAKRARG